MINLFCYLNESRFSSDDFIKHSYKEDVINKIINTGNIRLGKNGESTIDIDDSIRAKLKSEFDEIGILKVTKEDFDKIMLKYNLPTWNKYFKGDFSGYVNGLSKNKGIEFEEKYVSNFDYYSEGLADFLGVDKLNMLQYNVVHCGGLNNKRPLKKGMYGPVIANNSATIGDDIADIKLVDSNGKTQYNLSLKAGNSTTFCNIGINKLFSASSFEKYKKTGHYVPEKNVNIDGQDLLDMLCINNDKFADTFISYKEKKQQENEVDITKELKHNKAIYDFLYSAIGYNYILVHQTASGKIEYYDLRTKTQMEKFLGNIISAKIYYGGMGGEAKRINIYIKTTKLKKILINIRSKNGSIYPTHIMCDYTI